MNSPFNRVRHGFNSLFKFLKEEFDSPDGVAILAAGYFTLMSPIMIPMFLVGFFVVGIIDSIELGIYYAKQWRNNESAI